VKRVTIDTNVFVSGLLFGGIPLVLLKTVLEKKFILIMSPDLISEIERVLSSKKFDLSKSEVRSLTSPLFEVSELVMPTQHLSVITRCPANNRVLECALEGKCHRIVSGDRRDLVNLKVFNGISIVTPRQFHSEIALS
jgi:putative PIN family toxin of toxin-antitoxin system